MNGVMGGFIVGSGRTVLCTATENMFGKTEKAMRANSILIKNMATVFTPGLMGALIEDTGEVVNSMGLLSIVLKLKQAFSAVMVFGQVVKGRSGLRLIRS